MTIFSDYTQRQVSVEEMLVFQDCYPKLFTMMMKLKKLAASLLVLTGLLIGSDAVAEETVNTTIGLIGDSTVADTYGWGPAFARRTKDSVTVLNFAKNGATLDSLSKKLDQLLLKKPDYVLVQFGHNDMKRYDSKAYGRKLADYIERIVKAGSQPIVLSSVTRRTFDQHGQISPAVIKGRTLAEYALTAKAIAKEKNALFIDLNTISIQHHNKINPLFPASGPANRSFNGLHPKSKFLALAPPCAPTRVLGNFSVKALPNTATHKNDPSFAT